MPNVIGAVVAVDVDQAWETIMLVVRGVFAVAFVMFVD
jgi:hypothetical protein